MGGKNTLGQSPDARGEDQGRNERGQILIEESGRSEELSYTRREGKRVFGSTKKGNLPPEKHSAGAKNDSPTLNDSRRGRKKRNEGTPL